MSTGTGPIAVSDRLRQLQPSPTLAVTSRAAAMRADGEDVIGFGAGEPDFPTPDHVIDAARRASAQPAMHRYTPAGGQPALREAIVEKTARDSGLSTTPAEVLVTNGGKQALYQTFQALLDPDDEVLLASPYWVSYPEQIRLASGRVVVVETTAEDGYLLDVDRLEAARTARTKALVFVSPSNPTGAVHPPERVAAIGRWAAEHGLWVVTDEIYEHLVYGDARHVSLPVEVEEVRPRCVVVNGVSKTFAMTGWRVGWSIAPAELTGAMTSLQSHLSSNVSNVAQAAALEALKGPTEIVEQMRRTYDRRRRVAAERLDALPGVRCPLPEGAFYAFPSVTGVLGRTIGGRRVDSSLELCEALLDSAKVALVPGEAFGAPGCVRLSYALGDEDLDRGLDRLERALGAAQ